jgi:formyl transferase-like protein
MGALRIAILTSHSAPGIEDLVRDPNRGAVYELAAVISSEIRFAEMELVEQAAIPIILQPNRRRAADRELDAEMAHLLGHLKADYLILVGYEHIVTDPLLEALPMRILKLHDGVSDALYEGASETRTTMSIVTDDGTEPLFLLSQPFAVASMAHDARAWGDADLLSDYAALHRRWMIRATWGPMLVRAIEFLAAGSVRIIHDIVWIDGAPGPCRLGTSPDICHDAAAEIDMRVPASCPFIRR